jgi:translation initiation factor IF-3
LINNQIYDREVRLIADDGAQLGVMSKFDAQKRAEAAGLDLVKIAANAKPAVCKIMDYGKFRFDEMKKEKEIKKAQKIVEIKEIRLSQTIDIGDFNTKLKHAKEFLEQGNKVRVNLKMQGRQQAHPEVSLEVLNKFAEQISEICIIDKKPTTEGRVMFLMLSPLKNK